MSTCVRARSGAPLVAKSTTMPRPVTETRATPVYRLRARTARMAAIMIGAEISCAGDCHAASWARHALDASSACLRRRRARRRSFRRRTAENRAGSGRSPTRTSGRSRAGHVVGVVRGEGQGHDDACAAASCARPEDAGAECERAERDEQRRLEAVPERQGGTGTRSGDARSRFGQAVGVGREPMVDDRARNPSPSDVAARSTGADRKPIGGSGHSVVSTSRLVQYAPHRKRMPYAAVSAEPSTTPIRATHPHAAPPSASCSRAVSAVSFATNPRVGMIPPSRRSR